MNTNNKNPLLFALFFTFLLVFSLVLNGAVPFLAMPTLGQAVWSMGFSHSFLNESIFSLYAKNFGAPAPAPISFGLSAVWPAALLIKWGLHAADAYSTIAAVWFSIAFIFAYKTARAAQLSPIHSTLAATLWLSNFYRFILTAVINDQPFD